MINFNNSVTDFEQSPGIAANTFANRPAATIVAEGTVYIATDTGNMYRSNGASWVSIGGGGSTPGIDTVLAQNEYLTANRSININNYQFKIEDILNAEDLLSLNYNIQILGTSDSNIKITTATQKIETYFGAVLKGFSLDFGNDIYSIGGEEYRIDLDIASEFIQTYTNSVKFGCKLGKDKAELGDYENQTILLELDKLTNTLQTYASSSKQGIKIFNRNVKIGDYDSVFNSTQININDSSQNIFLLANSGITIGNNNLTGLIFGATSVRFNGTNLASATAGGASGNHLIINLNGTNYKIALLNV